MADSTDPPRLRFAKREISRALEALEHVDADRFNTAVRLLQVEDELADTREQSLRWRQSHQAAMELVGELAGVDGATRVKALDKAMRVWASRA